MYKKLLFIILFTSSLLNAKDNFVYGIGSTIISIPSYIGSSKQNNFLLPFPYIQYKSKYINIDRDKIYNEFYRKDKIQLQFSLSGMLPVESKDTARDGMKDLDAIIEIGPKFIYNILSKNKMKINLEIPIRAAISFGDSFNYEGYLASMDVKLEKQIFNNYTFKLLSGLGYSDKNLNNYYYEVNSAYVNLNRKEYHSSGGYSGFHNSIAITKKNDKFWYGAFVKHYYLNNTAFQKSPLVEKHNSIFYGLAFSYLF